MLKSMHTCTRVAKQNTFVSKTVNKRRDNLAESVKRLGFLFALLTFQGKLI